MCSHFLDDVGRRDSRTLQGLSSDLFRDESRKVRMMYIVIRSYDLIAGKREECLQGVQERLIPLLNHVPGFRAFTLLEAGENNVTFISAFNTLADAKASARLTNDFHTEHLNVFIKGYTRIAAGEVRVRTGCEDVN
jgi:heme-degrading monooxygenase HmoA